MRWKYTAIAQALAATCLAMSFALASQAYVADKARLDKAAAACDAGKYAEGAAQFKQLGDEGDPFAQCVMGVMYLNGRGVKKNVHSAIAWFMKSAKQGNPVAEEHLGEVYHYGEEGIKKDNKEATFWYRRAAYHGNQKAQMALFKMFSTNHITGDDAEGRMWLRKACQIPGELSEEAHKAFMSLPPMKEAAKVQENFEYEFADMAVGGTLKRTPEEQALITPQVTPIKQPSGMPGALQDTWDKFASLEKSLYESARQELQTLTGH